MPTLSSNLWFMDWLVSSINFHKLHVVLAGTYPAKALSVATFWFLNSKNELSILRPPKSIVVDM